MERSLLHDHSTESVDGWSTLSGQMVSVERSLLHDHSTESVDGWSTLSGRMVSVERSLFNLCDHSTESVERSQKCTHVDSTDSVESTTSYRKTPSLNPDKSKLIISAL